MEALGVALKEAQARGEFEGINFLSDSLSISHLFYADDAVFVGKWSEANILNLMRILHCFNLTSGLKINLEKTNLFGVGSQSQEVVDMADKIGCKGGAFPFKFLGIPVGSSPSRINFWQPLVDKFHNKLSTWKSISLSYAGKVTLCKSVLGSLGNYLFSLYEAPAAVLNSLERLRSKFFWGVKEQEKKVSWIAWNDMIASKEAGGLGIGSLKALNLALMAKWWWRVKTEKDALWVQLISAIHGTRRNCRIDPLESKKGGPWGRIIAIKKRFEEANIDLQSIFYEDQSAGSSKWKCQLSSSGDFSVSVVRSLIQNAGAGPNRHPKTVWVKAIPSKINILVWRLSHRRLPTFENLARRNIIQDSKQCLLCNLALESEDHVFMVCPVAQCLIQMIADWWMVPNTPRSLETLLNWGQEINLKGDSLVAFSSVVFTCCWLIWNTRNERLHDSCSRRSQGLDMSLQGLTFFWLRVRSKLKKKLDWCLWCTAPKLCF